LRWIKAAGGKTQHGQQGAKKVLSFHGSVRGEAWKSAGLSEDTKTTKKNPHRRVSGRGKLRVYRIACPCVAWQNVAGD
jgi:hypothetical protein